MTPPWVTIKIGDVWLGKVYEGKRIPLALEIVEWPGDIVMTVQNVWTRTQLDYQVIVLSECVWSGQDTNETKIEALIKLGFGIVEGRYGLGR